MSAFLFAFIAGCSANTSTKTVGETAQNNSTGAAAEAKTLTIYSGREEKIIGPLLEKAEAELGLDIKVRYGGSTELAIALTEESANSPADVFYSQDSGALGAVANAGLAVTLPDQLLDAVDPKFRSTSDEWVGISGRVRVLNYNVDTVTANELPASVFDLSDPKWRGKLGWAPTNGSFQAFVTAMRVTHGEEKTLAWLKSIKANEPRSYDGNTAIVEALGRGEVAIGLVNNYYLYRFKSKDTDFPVATHHFKGGDVGSLINAAGLAILKTTDQQSDAEKFVEYMLSEETQRFLTDEFYEYPLAFGIEASHKQLPLAELEPPVINLSTLAEIEGTLALLQDAGLL